MVIPSFKFKYWLAGTGPDESAIKLLVEQNNLSDEVKLLGWVEIDKMIELYQSAHIFLHPSHFDPFPNVVMEALACGLPVIGSAAAGSVFDRIKSGVNGFSFSDGDEEKCMEHIRYVLENRDKLNSMSVKAREMAEQWKVSYNIDQLNLLLCKA